MAITYITGVSGSGKTYFSTYTIYKMFKNDLKKVNFVIQWFRFYIAPVKPKFLYKRVYTNINQFNYDFHPNLVPFDYVSFRNDLKKLHRFKVKDCFTDDELIVEAKRLDLYDILVVWDEIQDHLKTPIDDVILWWFTYHRHLKHQIHMITQDLTQIPKDYLKNGTYFYKMPSPAVALFKNKFTVSYYSCLGMTQKCRDKSFIIPFIAKVGELYVSGDVAERKPILKKFVLIFPIMILLMYGAFEYFNSTRISESAKFSGTKNNLDINSTDTPIFINSVDEIPYSEETQSQDLKKQRIVIFKCLNKLCKYRKSEVPIDFLVYLVENFDIRYSNLNKVSNSYSLYTFLLSEDIANLLNISFEDKSKSKKNSVYQRPKKINMKGIQK